MKYLSIAFLAAISLLNDSAHAGDAGSTLGVGGYAPPVCSFTAAARSLTSDNMTFSPGGVSSGLISVDHLVDENTGLLKHASISLEILGVCNQSHYLSLLTTKGGLTLDQQATVVSGSFIQHVNYRAQVDWGGRTAVLNTDATPGKKSSAASIDGPNSGSLNVSLTIDETNNDFTAPALAGNYLDSLIVQIGLPL